MLKLKKLVLKEDVKPVDISSEQDLQTLDTIIQYCKEMGENSPVIWRGMRVAKNYEIYHVVQDRDTFRGGNLGAQTIIKALGIKRPLFAYIGNMQSVTKIFGRTFAVVLKKPYRLFQSAVVDDVMAWAQPTIYTQSIENGGLYRQSAGQRTEEEQIEKALEGAKTYKELNTIKTIDGTLNEVILDTDEYWIVDINTVYGRAGKFVRQIHREKKPVSFSSTLNTSDYIENYGEIIDILQTFRKFTAWKIKNPR